MTFGLLETFRKLVNRFSWARKRKSNLKTIMTLLWIYLLPFLWEMNVCISYFYYFDSSASKVIYLKTCSLNINPEDNINGHPEVFQLKFHWMGH